MSTSVNTVFVLNYRDKVGFIEEVGYDPVQVAYDFAFDVHTGEIAEDHGLLECDETAIRFVDVNPVTNIAYEEWSNCGIDILRDDFKKIGALLIAKPKRINNVFDLDLVEPLRGELVLVYRFTFGYDEETASASREFWSDHEFLGELSQLINK